MIGLWEPGHRDRDIEIWQYSTFKLEITRLEENAKVWILLTAKKSIRKEERDNKMMDFH